MRSIGKALSILATVALSWSMTVPAEASPKKAVAAKKAPQKKAAQQKAAQQKAAQRKPAAQKASAQTNRAETPSNRVTSSSDEQGYEYRFQDDPLYGTNGAANAARIIVRRQGVRNTLLRPRLHFIPELLKSVENL